MQATESGTTRLAQAYTLPYTREQRNHLMAVRAIQMIGENRNLELPTTEDASPFTATFALSELTDMLGMLPSHEEDLDTVEDWMEELRAALNPTPLHLALIFCFRAIDSKCEAESAEALQDALKWISRMIGGQQ